MSSGTAESADERAERNTDREALSDRIGAASEDARALAAVVDARTVRTNPELDEDAFFTTADGRTTIANRYDLERAVALEQKPHLREVERYWVNEPYAFVVVFHSEMENERKYYAVEPHLTPIELDLQEFLAGKLRAAIKYSDDEVVVRGDDADRAGVIERETERLLDRYDLYAGPVADTGESGLFDRLKTALGRDGPTEADEGTELEGIAARPEPAVLEADARMLTAYQVEKLLYRLKRDFIGYDRIDPIKHDVNVEDISCDGYDGPVFVYHSDHEQLISNIRHGEDELDEFVVKLAQRSGKGISKRQPQVDATLPDGSRAQLTLGREVSDHGTNYTIRQFKDVPYTPIDLINWHTFSLDEMVFLWLCIENRKSTLFAGGTASGKTTSLNAVSLFIPSNSKVVSIESTRELEIPQRNWIASVTRPSFTGDDSGAVDEFDLLEAALRQRPEYIVMGEIRGEEGRTLFQVMSTGHTSLTTFHADTVGEVIKRFTTDPINVSKTLFTALDVVSVQTQTRVEGQKVRRSKAITEINYYDSEHDEINVRDVFQWQAETDEYLRTGASATLDDIKFDRGWSDERLRTERQKRTLVLAYLIDRGINTYTEVAATIQAFINDPEAILALIADERLQESLEDLRMMESISIDTDPETEAIVPRPDPGPELAEQCTTVLEEGEELLGEYRGRSTSSVAEALPDAEQDPDSDPAASDPATATVEADGSGFADFEPAEPASTGDDGATDSDGSGGPEDGGVDPGAGR